MKKVIITMIISAPVLILVGLSVVFAIGAVGRPFPGFLVYPNLLISPHYLPGWLPPEEGITYPGALDSIDSVHLRSAQDQDAILAVMTPGDVHLFTIVKGEDRVVKGLPIVRFQPTDLLGICGPLMASALIVLATALFIGASIPSCPASRSLFAFCLSLGGWMGTLPDWTISHTIPLALPFFVSMTSGALTSLYLSFPSPSGRCQRRPALIPVIGGIVGFCIFALYALSISSPSGYAVIDSMYTGLLTILWVSFGVRLARTWGPAADGKDRLIARVSLWRGFIPFGILMVPLVFFFLFHIRYGLHAFSLPLMCIPPVAMAWALYKGSRLGPM